MTEKSHTIPIALWFARHTIRPLMATSALFVLAILSMLLFLVSSKQQQNDDSATRLMRMAELAALQRNRPFIESLAELGRNDIGLISLSICEDARPLFLFPENHSSCEPSLSFLQKKMTHQIAGLENTAVKVVIPRYPGYQIGLTGLGIAGFFVFSTTMIYRKIGRRLREQILKPILAGVKNEDLIASMRPTIQIQELEEIFAAYEKKLSDLRILGAENALNAKAAALTHMSQALAHDLKNPLSLFEFAMSARSLEEFENAKLSMERAFERIHAILANIGQKSSDLVMKRETSILDCSHVATQFRLTHGHLGVEVLSEGPTVEANIDKPAIERCLVNLVGNAIEATASKVQLVVGVDERDLMIEVKDNGPGVSQELLPKLFVRGATFGKESGEGIGLYNVKSIVEAHGGEISYSREGNESIFRLRLPGILTPDQLPEIQPNHSPIPTIDPKTPTGRSQILLYLSDQKRAIELAAALEHLTADICFDPATSSNPVLIYTDNIVEISRLVSKGVKLCLDSSSTSIESASRQIQLMVKSINNPATEGQT